MSRPRDQGHEGFPRAGAGALPRILSGVDSSGATVGLADHLAHWGFPPRRSPGQRAALIGEIERSGLRGRGGASFPTHRKWRAVSSRRLRGAVVVANGAEAEPASAKDRLLLLGVPHLVLDGASLAAWAVGASRVVVYAPRSLLVHLGAAVAERRGYGLDPVRIELFASATSFVAGEESAVVGHLNGGPGARPGFTALVPVYQKGVGGRPTLVQNVETLAQAALIGRFGADWFRAAGTPDSPGTTLLSISGAGGSGPCVIEIALGTTLGSVLSAAGIRPEAVGAVLTGGFGGTWIDGGEHLDLPLCEDGLRSVGATLGAGVLGVLEPGACPLAETAHIAGYLQTQGAGQCGPCLHGLPAIASAMAALAWSPRPPAAVVERLSELCGEVEGRGACHHPDGAVRLVRSALSVFPAHVRQHQRYGPCPAASAGPALGRPTPRSRDRVSP